MKINFLDEATFELDEAIEYYNNQAVGLVYDFLKEVLSAIDRISNYPNAWHPYLKTQKDAKPDASLMVSFTRY